MKRYISSVLMIVGSVFIGIGITSTLINVRENHIKAVRENPEIVMSKDDILIKRMTSIVDNFTELNRKLEEVIESQKQQNEAMKQELNSRIQNYSQRNTLEIRPEMYEKWEIATSGNTLLPHGILYNNHFNLASD